MRQIVEVHVTLRKLVGVLREKFQLRAGRQGVKHEHLRLGVVEQVVLRGGLRRVEPARNLTRKGKRDNLVRARERGRPFRDVRARRARFGRLVRERLDELPHVEVRVVGKFPLPHAHLHRHRHDILCTCDEQIRRRVDDDPAHHSSPLPPVRAQCRRRSAVFRNLSVSH